MSELPEFYVRPPLRCYELVDLRTGARCGAPATRQRGTSARQPYGYFCAAHALEGDVAIAPDAVFRRVGITLDVLFSGVSWERTTAQAEALGRLEAAIAACGGLVSLHTCRSDMGHARPPRSTTAGIGNGGSS